MYKEDLALNNQQWLICHLTKQNKTTLNLARKSSRPMERQLKTKRNCFNYLSMDTHFVQLFSLFEGAILRL